VKSRKWDIIKAEALYVDGMRAVLIAHEVGAPSVAAIRTTATREGWQRKTQPERLTRSYTSPRRTKIVNLRCYRCLGHYENTAVHRCPKIRAAVLRETPHPVPAWHSIYVGKEDAA
jgi:hypothetical protein